MFEQSRQARYMIPMAISLAWGVLFATVITLLLVPVNTLILEDIKRGLKRYWRWQTNTSATEKDDTLPDSKGAAS